MTTARQPIPDAEDLPLILSWVKLCTDPAQRCELRNCTRPAQFAVDEYEDKNVVFEAVHRGITDMKELEDILWRHTMHEQMQNRFVVHSVTYMCFDCQLGILTRFLNTAKDQDLHLWLKSMPSDGALVAFHDLSYPELGLVAPTTCKTPQEFLQYLRTGHRIEWKVQ